MNEKDLISMAYEVKETTEYLMNMREIGALNNLSYTDTSRNELLRIVNKFNKKSREIDEFVLE